MRIFLTGSTGFIGQSLVRAMRRRDWAVQALVRDQKGTAARWLSDQRCTLIAGDVTRPEGPRDASVRETNQSQNGKLELGRHVAVGWQVTIDFETDADFD